MATYTDIPPISGGGGGTSDGVTITGDGSGGNPFAGLPSSATNAGTMSAANFKKAAAYDDDGWFLAQRTLMLANASALTHFREVPGVVDISGGIAVGAIPNDGLTEGGALGIPAAAFQAITRTVFQTPKTKSWACAFRAIIATIAGAESNAVGVLTSAPQGVEVGAFNSFNTGLTYQLVLIGGANTVVDTGVSVDGLVHDFVITFDVTTVKAFIDGTQRASTATLTNLTTNPAALIGTNTTAAHTKILRAAYGYVAP
jgi:hypothetical protein